MGKDEASPPVGIVLTALCLLLVAGVMTFAGPCEAHDDGGMVSCMWAARAVTGSGVVALVLSVVRIFERDEGERRGLSLSVCLLGALVALTPGVLVDLCPVDTMRCHAVMRPFVVCVGTLIVLVAGVDLVRRLLAIGGHGS